jgi:hypothetical protein
MRVHQMVRQVVEGCSEGIHAARFAAVIKVTEGVIRGGRLTPATIGRNLPGEAKPKHGIKCVDRLLGSLRAEDRLFIFLALSHRLLLGCPRPVVLVDWTHAGEAQHALVAAVPIGGRALPIYLEVHPESKLGNAAVEARFLCTLKSILPSDCRPVVVTDAGFKGPFFEEVLKQGWDFLGRIRGTAKAVSDDTGQIISKEEFYAGATTTPTDVGSFELFVKQRIPCRLVLVRKRRKPGRKPPPPKCKEERELRQSALDPWLLATSLPDSDDASKVVSLYAKRMQIEETFRDAKNHRFGWSLGYVSLSTPARTAALLVLAALAITVVTLIGMTAERQQLHRAYQANTYRRRVLSFFVLACALLKDGRHNIRLRDFRISLTSICMVTHA